LASEHIKKYSFVTKKLNLLIAEDDQSILFSLKKALSPFFNDVLAANNGKEALDIFKDPTIKIDILITDIMMPIMDGVKLVQEIRRIDLHIPIIVASAYSDAGDFLELLNLGIEAFLPKPLDLSSFLHHVYSVAVKIDDAKIVERYQVMLEKHIALAKKKIAEQQGEIESLKSQLCAIDSSNQVCTISTDEKAPKNSASTKNITTSEDDYFGDLNKEDRQDIADAIDDLINHVVLIKNGSGSVDRARLQYALFELRRLTLLLHKSRTFTRLADQIDELYSVLSNAATTVLQQHDRLIMKLIEELAYMLEKFVTDIINIKSDSPNYYDDTIIADIASVLISINAKKVEETDTYECELF
jgi:YesN/AraC family two-component response regulator